MVLTKLSSFGRGRDNDVSNARYISRYDTLTDEQGRHIPRASILRAVDERMQYVSSKKTSFRVIVSLPLGQAEQARQIVEDIVRSRYGTFLSACHQINDVQKDQPHLHFLIFNDVKNHPLSSLSEIHDLRREIDREFKRQGIAFSKPNPDQDKKKQAEIRMEKRGEQCWKSDLRKGVRTAMDSAKDYPDFTARLSRDGIKISRETEHSLTFQDSAGHKVRAGSLFSKYRTKGDIENKISSNVDRHGRYQKAVNKLSTSIDRKISALKYEGSEEGVKALQELKIKLADPALSEGTLTEKWSQYKDIRSQVENVLPYEQMREIETARFSEALDTKRGCNAAASALLSQGQGNDQGPATGQGGEEGGGSGGADTKGKSKEEARAIKDGHKIRMDGQKALKILIQESKKTAKNTEAQRKKAEMEAEETAQNLSALARMGFKKDEGGSAAGSGIEPGK